MNDDDRVLWITVFLTVASVAGWVIAMMVKVLNV